MPTLCNTIGIAKIRAALREGKGFLTEFWPKPVAGGWPPEFDVAQTLGRDPGIVHLTGDDVGGPKGSAAYIDHTDPMHIYGLNWTRDRLTWYAEG